MRVELLQLNAFNVVSTCTYCIPMRDDMIWSPSLVVRIVNWKVSGRERKHIDVLLCYFITTTSTPITTFSNYSIIATYITWCTICKRTVCCG